MIKAEVIADSRNQFGDRLGTMVVTFPRIILAEFNTHRMFSRNSASSRAIPFPKMIESVKTNPFVPMAWQKNHTGMQGTEYLSERDVEVSRSAWLVARDRAVTQAEHIAERGATKQLVNRLLEPFMWHTCIVSATEWENFFALRCPQYTDSSGTVYRSKKDMIKVVSAMGEATPMNWYEVNKGAAEIHMMALAEAMWDAYNESTPKELKFGEWHIPFFTQNWGSLVEVIDHPATQGKTPEEVAVMIATARCAGVSYTIADEEGKPVSYEKLIARHDKLAKDGHWSPFEHCAQANDMSDINGHSVWSGNFRGFIQYRKMFDNENISLR